MRKITRLVIFPNFFRFATEKLRISYRGETREREIIPKEIKFLSTKWHPEEQWCLVAHDVEKDAERTFACKDIKEWKVD